MDWISNGWKFCCWILYGNILYKSCTTKLEKGTRQMNANELVDEIKNALDPKAPFIKLWIHDLLEESATMLRQQQEQIKEKDVCLKLLANEIEALKAELKERFEAGKAFGYAEGLSKAFYKGVEM